MITKLIQRLQIYRKVPNILPLHPNTRLFKRLSPLNAARFILQTKSDSAFREYGISWHSTRFFSTISNSIEQNETPINSGDHDSKGDGIPDKKYKINVISLICTHCGVKLKSRKELRAHEKDKHGINSRILICKLDGCNNIKFTRSREYLKHMKERHPERADPWPCDQCSATYKTRNVLLVHQYEKHQPGVFECGHDGCHFMSTLNKVRNHISLNHIPDDQMFFCKWQHCHYQTSHRNALVRHIRKQHFGLPESFQEQRRLKIVDDRDVNDYIRPMNYSNK